MSIQVSLENKLKMVRDNDQFIQGVISFAETEDNMQTILDYISAHPGCNDQDISMLAFELHDMVEIPVGSEEYKRRIKELMEE